MECHRNLELTLISAKGLKNTRFIGKLSVYAVASISGSHQNFTTSVTKGTNPIWNFPMKFTVNEATVIIIKIKAVGWFVNKELGVVHVPIKDLMKLKGIKNEGNAIMQFVSFPVIRGGKPKGDLSLSYKFGEEPAPALMATTSYNPPPEPPAKFTAYFFHKKQQSAQETTKKAAEPVASTSAKSSGPPPPQRRVKKKNVAMAMATFGGGGGCGGGGCGGGGCGGGGCGGGGCGGC